MKLKIRIIFSSAALLLFTFSPLCGIPLSWKTNVALILALVILLTTYLLHRSILLSSFMQRKSERVTEAYSENGIQHTTHAGAR